MTKKQVGLTYAATPAISRMVNRILVDDGCWKWVGTKDRYGYGRISDLLKHRANPTKYPEYPMVHRVMYEHFVAPIPDDYEVDHLCRNTSCVRPSHLEAVTPNTNNARGTSPSSINKRKIVCKRGHPLDGKRADGGRYCITCNHAFGFARRRRLGMPMQVDADGNRVPVGQRGLPHLVDTARLSK